MRTPAQLALGIGLRPRAELEDLEPGPNAEALAAVRAIATGRAPGPLYLAGAGGTGKTALLLAALREAQRCGRRGAYVPLAELAGPEALVGLEALDLLCLDDLEAVAGQAYWEGALFDLYNRLRERGGAWLAAARPRPARLGLGLADLRSRLGWGLVYELRPLDDDGLAGALQRQAHARGLSLDAEVAGYLLRRRSRTLPDLMALLDRLDAAALAAQRRLTLPFVRAVLESEDD